MEKITLSEQDVINAICLFHAKFKNRQPEEVEVELMYDDLSGYTAEASIDGQIEYYNTVNFIMAIRLFIDEMLNRDSKSCRITLHLTDDEGIIAKLEW